MSALIILIVVVQVVASVLVGRYADGKGYSFAGFFFLSLFFSFVLGGIIAAILPDRRELGSSRGSTGVVAETPPAPGPEPRPSAVYSRSDALLRVEDLTVRFTTDEGVVKAVNGVSYDVARGETLGIVGESGSGKSVANMTILGLTRAGNAEISGRIDFEGTDLTELDDEGLREYRGSQISMIFQDPLSSLHPFYKVGKQLVEAIQVHQDLDDDAAMERAVELLGLVGIPDPERRVGEYPHEFSGGMRQRAMIAMALTNEPKLLIADEPTTALDVTTQAQILRLLERLQKEFGMAMIMITHDLGVVAEVADRVQVMYGGMIVESGTLDQIFYDPQHPYTWGLLGSITRVDRPRTARLAQIAGQPPSLIALPQGCPFRARCPHEFDKCSQLPPLEERIPERGHTDRCWLTPDQKRTLRVVSSGEIGLETSAEEPAA